MNLTAVQFRDYNKIFTGTNESGGYDHPFLGFTTEYQDIQLTTDKSTYFHYPDTASIPLTSAGLIEAGAIAGSTPFCADRVFKKLGGYPNEHYYGDALPTSQQNGTWLCSWLSGNTVDSSQIPMWVDRWYDPGQIDTMTALFVSSTSAVYDKLSELTFDAKTWYRYDRIGVQTNESIVSLLTANSALSLHLEDWSSADVADNSGMGNDGVVSNFTSDCIYAGVAPYIYPQDTSLKLNGIDQDCQVVYSNSLALTGNNTVSLWVNPGDWSNIKGSHIISNSFRGGWNIKSNNGFNPTNMAVFNSSGYYIMFNPKGKVFYNGSLPGAGITSSPACMAMDAEYFVWVLDDGIYSNSKHLYKVDYNGDINTFASIPTARTCEWIALDSDNIRVLTTQAASSIITTYDKYCTVVSEITSAGTSTMLEVSLTGDNILSNLVAIDSNDTQFTATGVLSSAIHIAIDKDDYIWLVTADNYYYKYTNSLALSLSGKISNSDSVSNCTINFTNEFDDQTYSTFVWFVHTDDKKIYKFNSSGTFIASIDTQIYNITPIANGDFTGYLANRKFNYIVLGKQPHLQAEVYLSTLNAPNTSTIYTISYPCSNLKTTEWALLSLTVDLVNKQFNFFVNSVLYDSISLDAADEQVFYYYQSPIMIGANLGKIFSIDQETGNAQNLHYKGLIDDIRLYNIALDATRIRYIYNRKQEYKDLIWSMPTPRRSYIEEIERFFKFKLPGQKSQYYNIHLKGLNITDASIRAMIEDIIRNTVKKVSPAHTMLYKVIWD